MVLDRPIAGESLTAATAPGSTLVAIVDEDPSFCSRTSVLLAGERVESFDSLHDVEIGLRPGEGAVAVFGPSHANGAAIKQIQLLGRRRPEIVPMMVVDRLSAKMLQSALRAGVRDVLLLPVEEKQLAAAVHQVAKALNSAGGLQARRAAEPGRVVTVFSAKGGSGTTTVACNLGVALARRKQGPVTLVDGDLQFGDASVMLQVAPEHTLVDVVAEIERLDEQLLESFLVEHPRSGLRVLPAPVEPAAADQVLAPELLEVVQTLRAMGNVVVVDTPSVFNDCVLGLLEESDDILLVAGLEIPSVKNLKLTIQTLRLLNVSMSKVKILFNRAGSKADLDLGEVERALEIKADALVPGDVAVPQSVNKGQPVVVDAPRSAAARALEDLAGHYARQPAAPGR